VITNGNVCDGSLSFKNYSQTKFDRESYNWLKVCFKAVTYSGEISYKMSDPVSWVQNSNIFARDYENWYSSSKQREDDSAYQVLFMMRASWSNSNIWSFIDINWDWLNDLLYVYKSNLTTNLSIMSNNWNYTFKNTYKCVFMDSRFYWDCADYTDL
jgi:hypothetical protein